MHKLNISPSSGIPIYKQLFEQFERLILTHYFAAGEALPSVRTLATELEVNPMTISKSYGLLEQQGYIIRLRGKGMIVAEQTGGLAEQERIERVKQLLLGVLTQADQMGFSQTALTELWQQQLTIYFSNNNKRKKS